MRFPHGMRIALVVPFAIIGLLLIACGATPRKFISLSESTAPVTATPNVYGGKMPLRVGIAAVISPRSTLEAYDGFLNVLAQRMKRPVQLVQRQTYAEVNELVRSRQVDVAFVCGGAYVEGQRQFGMELLAAPQVNGGTVYYSYLIVPADSAVKSWDGLRGKVFAFSDPLSNSGNLAPTFQLAQKGATPETFFARTIFTYSHDNSIRAVASELVDGAAVDSLVYDALVATNPELGTATRVIAQSPPYGIPPVVVHPELDPVLKQELRAALLHMHDDDVGRAALARLRVDRFVVVHDRTYDSIREMARVVRR